MHTGAHVRATIAAIQGFELDAGTWVSLIGLGVGLLFGLVAVLILRVELKTRTILMQAEHELQKRKFEAEQDDRRAKQAWLAEQRVALDEMAKPLTSSIAAELRKDVSWAAQALEKAKLGPYSKTLFGDREGHFREEKLLIAERFVPMLLRRCRHLSDEGRQHVYLLIDSGTTLYPFFKLLAEQTVRALESDETWMREHSLTIVTNNLPGVRELMEHGRPNPNNRYSGLAVDCRLLPGVPLPVYSAVTGKETEQAIRALREQATKQNSKPVFIGVVTGNWVRIRHTEPRCPVPLARGEGHLPFKQALIDACDEVYVIAPLGKIFANVEKDEVNKLLGLDNKQRDPERQEYQEVYIDRNARAVNLVSTSRREGRLLRNLSGYLRGGLRIAETVDEDAFVSTGLGRSGHVLFPFDNLPDDGYLEIEAEFPHRPTRREDFRNAFLNP